MNTKVFRETNSCFLKSEQPDLVRSFEHPEQTDHPKTLAKCHIASSHFIDEKEISSDLDAKTYGRCFTQV